MKLGKRNLTLVSFMLFSLFFGAGNLIFPPFLGQNAGSNAVSAWLGFLITAVLLPVMAVVVVAKFDGLEKLSRRVNPIFAMIFTIAIYLSIGPGLGIPRAASVPFEMAIAPYLPEGFNFGWMMLLYSSIFFALALWLALSPSKLVNRIGKVMTPSLLILITALFISFLIKGKSGVAAPQEAYASSPFVKGFLEGYNTMDAIAGLNFGLVIAAALNSLHVNEKKDVMHYTILGGIFAGTILASIYGMLAYLGMKVSNVYALQENGAWTLRCIVHQVFGEGGAILLAATFTLACLTTCVGLITSISQYFSTLTKKLSYRAWAIIITIFSFAVCNQGLTAILSISVPVLNIVYPVAIVLMIMGLCDKWLGNNKFIYPVVIFGVSIISIVYALDDLIGLGSVSTFLNKYLPLYNVGMGWVLLSVILVVICLVANLFVNKNKKEALATVTTTSETSSVESSNTTDQVASNK